MFKFETISMAVPKKATALKSFSKSLDKMERGLSCPIVLAGLIVATSVLFAGNLFLTALAGNPELSGGLFTRGISQVSAQFPLNITPAGFTFAIWGAIYLLQIGWNLYSLSSLCRFTENGPVYLNPPVLGTSFFVYFNVSTLAVSAWLFMWDRLLFFAAFVFLAIVAISLFMTVFSGASSLARYRSELVDQGRCLDVKILTVTMVNGVSMYATWSVVATLINFGIILVYKLQTPLSNELASIICLSILGLFVLLYTVLDATILRSFNRCNFTPFLTVIWALIGVLANNLDFGNVSTIVSIVLLVGTSAIFLVKAVFSILPFARVEQYEYRQMKFARCVTPVLENKADNCCITPALEKKAGNC
ncbi:hypothetical protein PoB_001810900 [Plakobranchus ocellatus]|uniref:Uncharacterized protein n=1 Tax=Plakobranchus ocellatus TaxID=259542 RepID=A0AAV3Z8H0_9GAST|nr:hypothetical protein PoB_001810900 [Plakobranchus ocellatus]